jgi:hypothetical protein
MYNKKMRKFVVLDIFCKTRDYKYYKNQLIYNVIQYYRIINSGNSPPSLIGGTSKVSNVRSLSFGSPLKFLANTYFLPTTIIKKVSRNINEVTVGCERRRFNILFMLGTIISFDKLL